MYLQKNGVERLFVSDAFNFYKGMKRDHSLSTLFQFQNKRLHIKTKF